ncbi:hypothetical protein RFI_09931 [Reticulomyxa filosa]|uniref:Uncharacterized protein n=1 Tax=Reticulomyxa filosa TaxID=46433 RepID=X6NNA3_RETFI|nr:hypothetical protein RFI_09931 [Reticulomyxa filosa]|eukprot:ETO27199.1 hypothetical protein RFI_09931 [Reticulomyxa filosa]
MDNDLIPTSEAIDKFCFRIEALFWFNTQFVGKEKAGCVLNGLKSAIVDLFLGIYDDCIRAECTDIEKQAKFEREYLLFLLRTYISFRGTIFDYPRNVYRVTVIGIVIQGVSTIALCIWGFLYGYKFMKQKQITTETTTTTSQSPGRHSNTRVVAVLGVFALYMFVLSMTLLVLFVRKLCQLVEMESDVPTKAPGQVMASTPSNSLNRSGPAPSIMTFSPFLPNAGTNTNKKIKITLTKEHQRFIKTMTNYSLLNITSSAMVSVVFIIVAIRFQISFGRLPTILDAAVFCCVVISVCIYLQFPFSEAIYSRLCHGCHACCFKFVKGRIKSRLRRKSLGDTLAMTEIVTLPAIESHPGGLV